MNDLRERLLAISADRRLVDLVYERLRSAIITGFFEPGQRMVERDLTTRLDVSRTPIREALKRLEQDGLIVCFPHRGYFVRQPTFDEARQAYELRRALEGLAAELAATRATDEELSALREAVRKGALALKAGDRQSLLLHNSELHLLVARASHNVFLEQQFRAVWSYVDLLRGRWWAKTDRPDTGHPEHEALVAALAAHDPASARRIQEQHVDRAWQNIARRFGRGEGGDRRADDQPREGPPRAEVRTSKLRSRGAARLAPGPTPSPRRRRGSARSGGGRHS